MAEPEVGQERQPKERLSNGQFADKSVRGGVKGGPKTPGSGRKKGTPNKITRKVKEFLAELVDDSEVQDAVRDRVIAGDAVAFFRALEHVVGKPKETVEANVTANVVYKWKDKE